jgi:hypothetical protein
LILPIHRPTTATRANTLTVNAISLMIHFLCITLVMLRILSEPGAVVWAMAHKKALPGQGFMRSVSGVGWRLRTYRFGGLVNCSTPAAR